VTAGPKASLRPEGQTRGVSLRHVKLYSLRVGEGRECTVEELGTDSLTLGVWKNVKAEHGDGRPIV